MMASRALPVLAVLGWATMASAAPAGAFAAELTWEEALGTGDIEIVGTAWAWNLAAAPGSGLTTITDAFLVIEGEQVVVREEFYDYKATPLAGVGADRKEPIQTKETPIESGRLQFAGARGELAMLGAAKDNAAKPLALSLKTDAVMLKPVPEININLFAGGIKDQDDRFDRRFQREGDAIATTMPGAPDAMEALGTFTVYLWEVDLQDADGQLYRSGIYRTNGVGAGVGGFEDGAAYDARQQLLAITITEGSIRFLIPEHPPALYYDPASTRVVNAGTWDLPTADGSLRWGSDDLTLAGESVHLDGELTAAFTGASAGAVTSTWSGSAREVSAGAESLTLATVDAPSPSQDRFLFWGIPLGVALLGAGGGAFVVLHRRGAPRAGPTHPALAQAAGAAPVAALGDDHEALLASAVEKLQSGHAAEVARDLQASFDKEHEAAPFQAYVLALAHLRLKGVEAAADWFLVAAKLYPNFAKELPVNESLKALRTHPRVRAELGLVEDSVAYV